MEPITLTNLHTKSLQEVFDYVAAHMLTQNARSLLPDGSGRAYRGQDGRMCAVGCLMSGDEYEVIDSVFRRGCVPGTAEGESVEGSRWVAVCRAMVHAGITCPSEDMQMLLTGLQRVHDRYNTRDWPQILSSTAAAHGLTFSPEKYRNAQ